MPDAPILPIDDPLLRQPSATVVAFDADLESLAESMFKIMDRDQGAGLAAVQIGIPQRLVVMDVPDGSGERHRFALANPEIIAGSDEKTVEREGCLSMPGYDLPVERSARIRARYQDLDGVERHIEADGVLAICLQHEIDHVNGVLFTDRVSKLRRDRARSYFAKVRRQHEAAAR